MKSLIELRTESKGNTRILWHHNYWDGPLSGVMLWNGEMCWFENYEDVVTEEPYDEERRAKAIAAYEKMNVQWEEEDMVHVNIDRLFKVYRLPEDVLDAMIYNHELFRKYVGDHTDYDLDGKRPIGKIRPSNEHGKFYDNRESHKTYVLDLPNYEIVGEFQY